MSAELDALFNAIAEGDRDAVRRSVEHRRVLEAFVPLDRGLLLGLKYEFDDGLSPGDLEHVEARYAKNSASPIHWQRTPLLFACRHADRFAITTLLEAGCKPGRTDAFGLSDVELCHEAGGAELVMFFLDEARRVGATVEPTPSALERFAVDPPLFEFVVGEVQLSKATKRRLLCVYAALTDVEAVRRLLATLDPNASTTKKDHPLFEACTSRILWRLEHPDFLEYAYTFTQANGAPGTHALHVPNHRIEAIGMGRAMAEAKALMAAKKEAAKSYRLDSKALAAQTKRRIEIVALLMKGGLTVERAVTKRPDFFASSILGTKQAALIEALRGYGFELRLDDYERELGRSGE